MPRPLYVRQSENLTGDFWYTVRGGNGENVLTSKMYRQRWRANRAARAFIKSIRPVRVHFAYWSGPTTPGGRGQLQYHSEVFE